MKKIYWLLLLLLGFHLILLSVLQFTAWPEMVSFPYFLNHGFITYREMVHVYPPLLIIVLAELYKIFGYKLIVLKIFGWISFLLNDVLVFLIIRKTSRKDSLAILGVLLYILLQPILEGNMVWPDLMMIPFILLSFLYLLDKKYFWSGLAVAFAVLTKQTGLLYLVFGSLYIAFSDKKRIHLINYLIGVLIITFPFLASLFFQKTFVDFINWTVIYPSQYWTKYPGYVQLSPTLRENLILLVLVLPLGFFIFKAKKKVFAEKYFLIIFGILVCGILGIYPRFSFFHFQPGLAFLVIIYIYLLKSIREKYLLLIFLVPLAIAVLSFRSLKFGEARFWAQSDLNLGRLIQSETKIGEPIYLLGLDSSEYAFADRLPNKPWLDNFGWYLEIPGVQIQVVNALKKDPPEKIFWQTPNDGNWFDIGAYQPKMITDWIRKNYNRKMEIQKGIWEWVRR